MSDDSVEQSFLNRMRAIGPVAVAYSGGVDSALVLAAVVRALGLERVLARTAVSESLAAGELPRARRLSDGLGVTHLTPCTGELGRPGYRANGRDRCYFCKSEVLDTSPLSPTITAARRWPPAPTPTTPAPPTARHPGRPGTRYSHPAPRHRPGQVGRTRTQQDLVAADLGQTRARVCPSGSGTASRSRTGWPGLTGRDRCAGGPG
ncbi:asparagine synthase-related protein [Streptomyces collinus]|uniref:asparagine synthase-related protein n=1 Tax=Streptomyces collinus TaxID=42684 RepID=UPI003439FDC6